MAQIVWSDQAIEDLKTIDELISRDSHFYALRFIEKLTSRVHQLILFPESGRIVPEMENPNIRELIEGNYRIFYSLNKNLIIILGIHNSARKIK